jgi:hypothetical protein
MIWNVAVPCFALLLIPLLAFSQTNTQVTNVVEIMKIDSKKMTLSVKSDLADGASIPRRGGLPPAGGRGGARGGYAGSGEVHTRQFKVYVTKETTLKAGGAIISFVSLKVGDHIAVTGTQKEGNIEATQIAKSTN